MADRIPEFESKDIQGTTEQISLTVGTTPQIYPAVADKRIEEIIIISGTESDTKAYLSIDNSNWLPILTFGHIAWSLKNNSGGNPIKQIYLKADEDSVPIYGFINYSPMST